jgi:hypothetical protein
VKVDQPLKHTLQNRGDFVLVKFFLSDIQEIDDTAGVTVLEDDPEIVVLEVGPVVFDDMFVVAQLQDLDLFLYCCDFGEAGGGEDLYCVQLARGQLHRFGD